MNHRRSRRLQRRIDRAFKKFIFHKNRGLNGGERPKLSEEIRRGIEPFHDTLRIELGLNPNGILNWYNEFLNYQKNNLKQKRKERIEIDKQRVKLIKDYNTLTKDYNKKLPGHRATMEGFTLLVNRQNILENKLNNKINLTEQEIKGLATLRTVVDRRRVEVNRQKSYMSGIKENINILNKQIDSVITQIRNIDQEISEIKITIGRVDDEIYRYRHEHMDVVRGGSDENPGMNRREIVERSIERIKGLINYARNRIAEMEREINESNDDYIKDTLRNEIHQHENNILWLQDLLNREYDKLHRLYENDISENPGPDVRTRRRGGSGGGGGPRGTYTSNPR